MDAREFYEQNFERVFRFFYYHGLKVEETKDYIQDSFLVIIENYKNVISSNPMEAEKILFGICKNKWKDWLSKQKDYPLSFEDAEEYISNFEIDLFYENSSSSKSSHSQTLIDAIGQLSPQLKQVVELRFFRKMTRRETGLEMGISEDSVYKYQKRAVKQLQEILNVNNSSNNEN